MTIDVNDPKWTEYALGELKDEKDKAEIETALARSAELRQLIEDIRNTAALLAAELKAEPSITLSQDQRSRIESKANAGRLWFGFKPAWALAGVVAALLLTLSILVNQFMRKETVAQQNSLKPATIIAEKQQAPTPKPATPETVEKTAAFQSRHTPVSTDKLESNRTPATPGNEKALPSPLAPSLKQQKEFITEIPEMAKTPQLVQQLEQFAVLKGTVMDASGSVIPGADIKVKDEATGVSITAKTDRTGQYTIAALSPGKHEITANMSGFQTAKLTDVYLNEASTKNIDIKLDVASVATQIEITSTVQNMLLESGSSTGAAFASAYMPASPPPGMPRPSYRGIPPWRRRDFDELFKVRRQPNNFNTEAYDNINDNPFQDVVQNPLSTFSIDVDTASYSNMRRFLDGGSLPPKDSIRIEELVNYFDYDYKGPQNGKLFAANFELSETPWNPEHKLLRIGLKAREVNIDKRPPSNLVFLLDVSGSMADENKLPLVKESMRLLADQLTESDRVAIVVYASDTSIILPSTSGDQKEKLRAAIGRLSAGGSTNGASGIQLAYQTAQQNFIQKGVNRVILATDGDFNVGITNRGDLTRLIEEKAKSGIYLSALGFGMGNYKDATLELLAKKGHGNYAYIDTLQEAKKVLVSQIQSTLVTIAKDVKIQVEFNPQHISAYRLIGYEDRIMPKEDFNDDSKDAGVIGAGHTVTALYELVPADKSMPTPSVDPLKYQKPVQRTQSAQSNELLTVKVRCKEPENDKSNLSEFTVKNPVEKFSEASKDLKFAAAVAAFGMVLRESPHKGNATLENALEWAKEGQGTDKFGYRREFIRLIHRAISLPPNPPKQ